MTKLYFEKWAVTFSKCGMKNLKKVTNAAHSKKVRNLWLTLDSVLEYTVLQDGKFVPL